MRLMLNRRSGFGAVAPGADSQLAQAIAAIQAQIDAIIRRLDEQARQLRALAAQHGTPQHKALAEQQIAALQQQAQPQLDALEAQRLRLVLALNQNDAIDKQLLVSAPDAWLRRWGLEPSQSAKLTLAHMLWYAARLRPGFLDHVAIYADRLVFYLDRAAYTSYEGSVNGFFPRPEEMDRVGGIREVLRTPVAAQEESGGRNDHDTAPVKTVSDLPWLMGGWVMGDWGKLGLVSTPTQSTSTAQLEMVLAEREFDFLNQATHHLYARSPVFAKISAGQGMSDAAIISFATSMAVSEVAAITAGPVGVVIAVIGMIFKGVGVAVDSAKADETAKAKTAELRRTFDSAANQASECIAAGGTPLESGSCIRPQALVPQATVHAPIDYQQQLAPLQSQRPAEGSWLPAVLLGGGVLGLAAWLWSRRRP
jgi:predicted phage tail protein